MCVCSVWGLKVGNQLGGSAEPADGWKRADGQVSVLTPPQRCTAGPLSPGGPLQNLLRAPSGMLYDFSEKLLEANTHENVWMEKQQNNRLELWALRMSTATRTVLKIPENTHKHTNLRHSFPTGAEGAQVATLPPLPPSPLLLLVSFFVP